MGPIVRLTLGVAVLGACLISLHVPALAANESVAIQTGMTPMSGKLYEDLRVPVQSRLEAEVSVPPGQGQILPLKRTQIRYDTDMTFNPNSRVTPACPDSKLNEQSNLAMGITLMVDRCPRSVVGTGRSSIFLVKQTGSPLDDPQMVIFNGGRNRAGDASIKIYAFSKATGTGVLMRGSLTSRGYMNVSIPVLSYDSAVGTFRFDIPGTGMEVEDAREPDGLRTVKGLDSHYVRSRCSDGRWTTGATFWLGERDPSTGQEAGPTTEVEAPAFNDFCSGLTGRPQLKRLRKIFPRASRRGSRPVIRVAVRNRGTATARNIRLVARGALRGKRKVRAVPPGATRFLKIRPRVVGRKGQVARAIVRVKANGSSVGFSSRIRIR